MKPARFDIHLGQTGSGARILINGENVASRCRALRVESAADETTRIILESYAEGRIQGEGIVYVEVPQDQRQALHEFLSSLDPATVEQDVLEKCGGLGGMSTGEAFLEVLKGYVGVDVDRT